MTSVVGEVPALLQLPEPLRTLHACSEEGWLRRLDSALAGFVAEQDPQPRQRCWWRWHYWPILRGGAIPACLSSNCCCLHQPCWPGRQQRSRV